MTVPTFHVTTPPSETTPPFVAETKVVPAGMGSRMTTFAAFCVPVFP
ncbi:MAG: hypothetical protein M3547_02255 [Acidobacteriota bacterium]|nr:hypothetical protein [Acidobacteriota bacterium]